MTPPKPRLVAGKDAPKPEAWESGPPPGMFDDGPANDEATMSGTAKVEAASPKPNPWRDRLTTVTADWLTKEPEPRRYLMIDTRTGKGAIPERGAAILGAAGGVGKSWLTIDAALSVVTGHVFCGVLRPAQPGRVLIVTAEDPADEIRHRLYHAARSRGIASIPDGAIDVIDVHDRHMPFLAPDASPTDAVWALVDLIERSGPYSLIVVDPLARISGASIDADNVAACGLMTMLERIATAGRGLVLGVHHTSQGARRGGILDATALRGATGLGDSARLVMLLTAEEVDLSDTPQWADLAEVVTLRRAKGNHVARWEPVQLRRGEHGELLPLDGGAAEIVARARQASDPAARRQAERDTVKTERDRALREIVIASVAAQPGISGAQLEIAMRARGATGQASTLRAAIESAILAEDIAVQTAARGTKAHHPVTPSESTSSSSGSPHTPLRPDEVRRTRSSGLVQASSSDEVDEVDEVDS